jgi:hypothetical protein
VSGRSGAEAALHEIDPQEYGLDVIAFVVRALPQGLAALLTVADDTTLTEAKVQAVFGQTRCAELSEGMRCPATNVPERPHLQASFAFPPPRLRMVEPIVKSTFGPRAGHEISSAWTTPRWRPKGAETGYVSFAEPTTHLFALANAPRALSRALDPREATLRCMRLEAVA